MSSVGYAWSRTAPLEPMAILDMAAAAPTELVRVLFDAVHLNL